MHSMLVVGPGLLAVALPVAGCFAIVDVDRFHKTAQLTTTPEAGAGQSDYQDLRLTLIGMTPHVNQLFEYRVVDSTRNFVVSRGVVNPLGDADVALGKRPDGTAIMGTVINMPLAVPKLDGALHFDFYADMDSSGNYNGLGSVLTNDHAWRIDPLDNYPPGSFTPVDGLVQVTFTHNTSFTDIDTWPSGTANMAHDLMIGATVHVKNADSVQGALIEVRIVDKGSSHNAGLFRIPKMSLGSFDMTVPGVVEAGSEYDVFAYVDANRNSTYDNPATSSGDLGWSVTGTADATGLNVTLDVASRPANVDVGAP